MYIICSYTENASSKNDVSNQDERNLEHGDGEASGVGVSFRVKMGNVLLLLYSNKKCCVDGGWRKRTLFCAPCSEQRLNS